MKIEKTADNFIAWANNHPEVEENNLIAEESWPKQRSRIVKRMPTENAKYEKPICAIDRFEIETQYSTGELKKNIDLFLSGLKNFWQN